MGTKREAPTMAGFFKISQKGEGFAGRLKGISNIGTEAKPNYIMLFSPCLIFRKNGKTKTVEAWQAVTINQSGDLRRKIDPEQKGKDFGKLFSGVYRDDEAVPNQPSKMKIFAVEELTVSEFKELTEGADMTHSKDAYPVEKKTRKDGDDETGEPEGTDAVDDDDLPF